MTVAREVLRDYGNMSAATVLFVLERRCRPSRPGAGALSDVGAGPRLQRRIPDDRGLSLLPTILLLLAALRIVELAVARRNTRRLLAEARSRPAARITPSSSRSISPGSWRCCARPGGRRLQWPCWSCSCCSSPAPLGDRDTGAVLDDPRHLLARHRWFAAAPSASSAIRTI